MTAAAKTNARFGGHGILIFMSKFIRSGLFVIWLGLLISSVSVTEAKSQNILGEILRRMDLNNKSLQSLKAKVTMTKYNPQLNVKDITEGSTSYLPKTDKHVMYVRIDWTTPVEEQVSVIGDAYELYRPRLQQVIVGKTNSSKNNASVGGALSFMSMSKSALAANYDVIYVDRENLAGETKTSHIHLTPKTATSYKSADLWVDDDGFPRQATITERNDDTTTVLLSNIQKNITLKASIFKLDYPKSVKKIPA